MKKKASQRAKLESQFLSITGLLVALIGGPAFLSILKEPLAQKVVARTVDSSRAPASFQSEAAPLFVANSNEEKTQVTSLSTLKLNCEDGLIKKEVDSNFIRLKGELCQNEQEMSILNRSNGFSASLFLGKNKKFTTDFIDLKEGENLLELTSIKQDGTKVLKSIHVHRRSPASKGMTDSN